MFDNGFGKAGVELAFGTKARGKALKSLVDARLLSVKLGFDLLLKVSDFAFHFGDNVF